MSALRRTVTAQGVTHSIGSPLPATLAIAPDGVDETAICSVHRGVADGQPANMAAMASSPNNRNMKTPHFPILAASHNFVVQAIGRYRGTANIPTPPCPLMCLVPRRRRRVTSV